MLTHKEFEKLLRFRWDVISVSTMSKEILVAAGIEAKDSYDKEEISKLIEGIVALDDPRCVVLIDKLGVFVEAGGAAKPEKKAEPLAVEPEKKADEKKEVAAPEKKADEKKADEKKADKKKGGKKKK